MHKIKIAVIGVGNMGRYHARVYSQLNNVELVAVTDTNDVVGMKIAQEFNCQYYKDHNELLKKENIDAISIVVPTKLHKKIALDVISHGKHLLIEKPIAANSQDAKEIISMAKKKKVILMVGHIERFNPAVQKLKKIIKAGNLGEIISIIARRVGVSPPKTNDANVIIDLAIHDIDVLSYLLNRQPTEAFAKGRKVLTSQVEDSAEIILSYDRVVGFIQVNWITPIKIRNLSVTGSNGYAELNYITQALDIYKSKYIKESNSFGEFIKLGKPIKKKIKIQKKEPLLCEIEAFIRCVTTKIQPLTTGEDGLKTLIVAEKALKSLKHGKIIKI